MLSYPDLVKMVSYNTTKFSKGWCLLKYTLLLWLTKHKEKRRLDHYLKEHERFNLNERLKSYQVLYHKPSIFHLQWAKSLEDWLWVTDFGMKLVLSLRGAHINYSPIVDTQLADCYQKGFPKVSRFHAVSRAIAEEATKYGATMDRIKVVKSGLNTKEIKFELKDILNETPLRIISIGRDHWVKNYRLALDVMFKLKSFGIVFQYTIIGIEENEALLYQRSELGLDEQIKFEPPVKYSQVLNAIQDADVFLLPSIKEGIANVVLEAMALGTLVVSTDCGGMREVVIHQKTGYLVPNRDVKAMSKALEEVSQLSTENYHRLTREARAFVETHHNREAMVKQMHAMYESVIKELE